MSERYNKYEKAPTQPSGRTIREEEDPLNRWEGWESAPKFLTDMVERYNSTPRQVNMKAFMEQVIRELQMTKNEQKKFLRPDPISFSYRQNYQYLKENIPKLNVNPSGLTIEQILATDTHFHRTYYNNNIYAQICQRYGLTTYMSGKKWEIKHHKITDYGWPKFSHTFHDLGMIQVGPEGVKQTGYGWGAAYEIPFTTIDMAAGGTYDPDYWSLFFLGEKMGIFGDEVGFLGGGGRNTTGRGAPNLKGLVNNGSVATNALTSPSTDCGFSSGRADFDDNFIDIKNSWYGNKVYAPGPMVYVSTPGIAAECYVGDSTVGDLKTVYQQVQHKWFMSGAVDSWWISHNLKSTAEASMTKTTQQYLAIKATPNYVRRVVVYPLQRKILSEKFKTYPDDIAFAYITGEIQQIYDANAFLTNTSSCKCQYRGWETNGLFMTASSTGPRALRPGVE